MSEFHDPLMEGAPALGGEHVCIGHVLEQPPVQSLSPPALRARGIRFIPYRGLVLWCDFQGYRPGEIGDKVRPAIVVSPWELNKQTACVVPVSQADIRATPLDVCLPADRYPFFTSGVDQWAKVQLLTHVEHARLDRMRVNGRWHAPSIAPPDLARILVAVASIFALPSSCEQQRPHQTPVECEEG